MLPYPTTGDGTPKNLKQQLAMQQAKLNPKEYKFSMPINDPRMPSWLGWQKYSKKLFLIVDYSMKYIMQAING